MYVTKVTNIGDPQIVLHEGKYYQYATFNDGKTLGIYCKPTFIFLKNIRRVFPSGYPRFSASRKRCCPPRGPRRHPACGCFDPPAFSWDPCRRAASCPPRRRQPVRRPCRPKIRHLHSYRSLLFRSEASMAETGRKKPLKGICQKVLHPLYCTVIELRKIKIWRGTV